MDIVMDFLKMIVEFLQKNAEWMWKSRNFPTLLVGMLIDVSTIEDNMEVP